MKRLSMSKKKNKPLRLTPEYFAQRAEQRATMEIAEFYVNNMAEAGEALDINIRLPRLFQLRSRIGSTYRKNINRSFTDSLESYQNGAYKETLILQQNGRIPKKELVIHFLKELLIVDIMSRRSKIFSILQKAGIEAVANIELTRVVPRIGLPNNQVHFHILTDDDRSEKELRDLFKKACEDSGLDKKDFKIGYKEIQDGYWYFEYFTKFDKKSRGKYTKEYIDEARKRDWSWLTVLLLEKIGVQKFYKIGKWFKKGRGKGKIWKEIKAIAAEKAAAKAETSEKENDDQESGKNGNETSTKIYETWTGQ